MPGNHDIKLLRKLRGRNVQVTHGLAESLGAARRDEPAEFRAAVRRRSSTGSSATTCSTAASSSSPTPGMKEEMQGRGSGRVREFALYGETTGETDEFGLPVRYDWAADYRGPAMVVYGHTPVPEPEWLNNTINIDTGCVFGGKLTALRYPERELVSVPAAREYYAAGAAVPGTPRPSPTQQAHDDLLDLDDVLGKRIVATRLRGSVTIREENAAAALEVMSRFAVDPRWLIYLPPTMSPTETTARATAARAPGGGVRVLPRRGRRAASSARRSTWARGRSWSSAATRRRRARGSASTRGSGALLHAHRAAVLRRRARDRLLERVRDALTRAGLWEALETDWVVLDCELMPWSAKAEELLRRQYAAVGAAARRRSPARSACSRAARGARAGRRRAARPHARSRASAWTAYTRRVPALLLAGGRRSTTCGWRRSICWPRERARSRAATTPGTWSTATRWSRPTRTVLRAHRTARRRAHRPASRGGGDRVVGGADRPGGEGMVVKPMTSPPAAARGQVQPGVKGRGREYLRIIYGPEYDAPDQLDRLRSRGLGRKRSLASREFALGVEALERFVRREPLYRVHECVFGVLALESEPVDPRL